MQLHHVTPGSLIRVIGDAKAPPCHREFKQGEELTFKHIDGMYSYCVDEQMNVVHLVAWAEVEVIRDGPSRQSLGEVLRKNNTEGVGHPLPLVNEVNEGEGDGPLPNGKPTSRGDYDE